MFEPLVFVAQGDGVGVTSGVGIARESVLKLNQLTPVLVRSTTLTNTSGVGIARESVLKLNQLTPVLVRSTKLTNTSGVGIARESVLTRRLI